MEYAKALLYTVFRTGSFPHVLIMSGEGDVLRGD
jgi:hypothetical protein